MAGTALQSGRRLRRLSRDERSRRRELEGVVKDAFVAGFAAGAALIEINETALYRSTHETFEDYVAELCEFSLQRAYQLMDAHRISTIVEIENEAQARPLAGLLRTGGEEAVREVFTAIKGRMTAKALQDAVRARQALSAGPAGRTSRAASPAGERQAEVLNVLLSSRSGQTRDSLWRSIFWLTQRQVDGAVRSLVASGVIVEGPGRTLHVAPAAREAIRVYRRIAKLR